MRFPVLQLALPLAAVLGIACDDPSGGGPGGGTQLPSEVFVTAQDDYFEPTSISVRVGGTVTWTVPGGPHNVTFSALSAPLDCDNTSGGTCARVFLGRGTFSYGCTNHDAMIGSVRVD